MGRLSPMCYCLECTVSVSHVRKAETETPHAAQGPHPRHQTLRAAPVSKDVRAAREGGLDLGLSGLTPQTIVHPSSPCTPRRSLPFPLTLLTLPHLPCELNLPSACSHARTLNPKTTLLILARPLLTPRLTLLHTSPENREGAPGRRSVSTSGGWPCRRHEAVSCWCR